MYFLPTTACRASESSALSLNNEPPPYSVMSEAPPVNIPLVVGPQLIGLLLAWGLQGAMTVQGYLYHLNFPSDNLVLKGLVYSIIIFEWIQTGFVTKDVVNNYIVYYHVGDISKILEYHSTWFTVQIMSAVISGIVQTYFCWRIWALSCSKLLAGIIFFLSVAQAALGFAAGVVMHVIEAKAIGESIYRPIVVSGLVIAAVVDIIIAVSMTVLLLQSKTGIKRSDDMLRRLVRLSIETGAMTAAVALLYAIIVSVDHKDLLFECPALVLAKLYSNTLLVSLNNRAYIQRSGEVRCGSDSEVHTFSGVVVREESGCSRNRHGIPALLQRCLARKQLQVNIREETYVSREVDRKDAGTGDVVELVSMGSSTRSEK